MESADNNESGTVIRSVKRIIVIYIIASIAIPWIFKWLIFENPALSLLTNNEWAGFLGSYAGGILGGLGTLISVFFTIKSSFDMQRENKLDTDRRIEAETRRHQDELEAETRRHQEELEAETKAHQEELQCENERRTREKEQEKRDFELRERRKFVCEIADQLGKFITNISVYCYACKSLEFLRDDFIRQKNRVVNEENKLDEINKKLENTIDDEMIVRTSLERDSCINSLERFKRLYNEASDRYQEERKRANRAVAIEMNFSIAAKLKGIDTAGALREKINLILGESGLEHEKVDEWIEKQTNELKALYQNFVDSYLNQQ